MALPNKELKAPALGQQSLDPKDFVSWAAYRASKTPLSIYKPAIVPLLVMFTEDAHSLAMIAHSAKVIKVALQHLNPCKRQLSPDQPLYALAKQIHCTLPEFDEDKFLAMMGGLHIEMASLKMLG